MKRSVFPLLPTTAADDPSAKVGKRELGKLEKANRIKAAARDLFYESGFEATTTQAVAERAGIGIGTLFSYASTKEDLLIIVFMDDLIQAARSARARAISSNSLLRRTHILHLGLMEYHNRNLGLSRRLVRELAYVESPDRRKNVEDLVRFIRDSQVEFIAREQARGRFRQGADAGLIADNCFAIYYNVLNAMLTGRRSFKEAEKLMLTRLDLQLEPYRTTP